MSSCCLEVSIIVQSLELVGKKAKQDGRKKDGKRRKQEESKEASGIRYNAEIWTWQ
jgi:hypothetical protein